MYNLNNVKTLKPLIRGLLLFLFCWSSLDSAAQNCQTQNDIKNALINCDSEFNTSFYFDPVITVLDPFGVCPEGNVV